MRHTLLLTVLVLFFMNCNDNPVSSPTIVNSETWKLMDSNNSSDSANVILNLQSNNAVSVSGKWTYEFYSNEVVCTFLAGNATIKDSSVTINVTGTAKYVDYDESSPFSLTMDGKFKNGRSSGDWEISFTKEDWKKSGMNGMYTGMLKSGTGVTR